MIVGVLGGGQLARMLALSGVPLGLDFQFLDPAPDACAFSLGKPLIGGYGDTALLEKMAAEVQAATYEFENVSLQAVRFLAQRIPLHPTPDILEIKQDRLLERRLFQELKIPTPDFLAVQTEQDLERAAEQFGFPFVLKTRSLGYDGKGVWVLQDKDGLKNLPERFVSSPVLAEQFIPFEREVSMIAARNPEGQIVYYPLVENTHKQGILIQSIVRPNDPVASTAETYLQRILTHFRYIGVLAVEFFQVQGRLIANEMAPRVHNTGHWTIEGAPTSQFENHLRALLGFPLGITASSAPTAMLNCIGNLPDRRAVLEIPDAHFHMYGKKPRPGRKVGHITLRAEDERRLGEKIRKVRQLLADSSAFV
ncbi:MAG: 5-(carboxyamino)imidazole ribonucleotide synthase [Anaerohalosphaeraceae bacterium]